jgi:DNA polymerase elongation subunit (family B)
MEEKMKLIEMALAIAYDGKVNYREVFTSVRMWDTLIHNELWRKDIAIPPKKHNIKTRAYSGAFVKDPQVGMHEWVLSFDLNSLYPHLIMQYNISPDTLVEDEYRDVEVDDLISGEAKNENKEFAMTANGRFFRKDKQGFLPAMMERMYNERVIAKKKMLESQAMLEQVTKRLKEYEHR